MSRGHPRECPGGDRDDLECAERHRRSVERRPAVTSGPAPVEILFIEEPPVTSTWSLPAGTHRPATSRPRRGKRPPVVGGGALLRRREIVPGTSGPRSCRARRLFFRVPSTWASAPPSRSMAPPRVAWPARSSMGAQLSRTRGISGPARQEWQRADRQRISQQRRIPAWSSSSRRSAICNRGIGNGYEAPRWPALLLAVGASPSFAAKRSGRASPVASGWPSRDADTGNPRMPGPHRRFHVTERFTHAFGRGHARPGARTRSRPRTAPAAALARAGSWSPAGSAGAAYTVVRTRRAATATSSRGRAVSG